MSEWQEWKQVITGSFGLCILFNLERKVREWSLKACLWDCCQVLCGCKILGAHDPGTVILKIAGYFYLQFCEVRKDCCHHVRHVYRFKVCLAERRANYWSREKYKWSAARLISWTTHSNAVSASSKTVSQIRASLMILGQKLQQSVELPVVHLVQIAVFSSDKTRPVIREICTARVGYF